MGLINLLRGPQIDVDLKIIKRVVWSRIQNKIRNRFIRYFPKVLNVTRRKRQFSDQSVGMKFFAGFNSGGILYSEIDMVRSQILDQAEKIMNHRFDLLGSGEVELGDKIDWHQDFKSGYRWSIKYYRFNDWEKANEVNVNTKMDIKAPWELSRLQHLVALGQAYWLSNDEKYTQEFMTEIFLD